MDSSYVHLLAAGETAAAGQIEIEVPQGPQAGRYAIAPDAACRQCQGRGRSVVILRTKVDAKTTREERGEEDCFCVRLRLQRHLDAQKPPAAVQAARAVRRATAAMVDRQLPHEIVRLEALVADRDRQIASLQEQRARFERARPQATEEEPPAVATQEGATP